MMEEIGKQIIIYENRRTDNSIFSREQKTVTRLFLTTPPLGKERYGRMRDRRMTMSIFPSRIIIRRSYSQKVLSVD